MLIGPEEIHLWIARDREIGDPELLAAYDGLMSDDERARAARFHFHKDYHQFRVSRALLRDMLSRYAPAVAPGDWRFVSTPAGRPGIASPHDGLGLWFSMSHCEEMIAVAIARFPVLGADVECVDRAMLDIAASARFLSDTERLYVHGGTHLTARFLEVWTLKEAYVKALGVGLKGIGSISFSFHGVGELRGVSTQGADAPLAGQGWDFRQCSIGERHVAALAARAAERPRLSIWSHVPLSGAPRPIAVTTNWRNAPAGLSS